LFKKKILIEKNEEINAVKRNLTDKDKEIKKLAKINEKNEMMLEMTAKEIINLRQEITKSRQNSTDGRRQASTEHSNTMNITTSTNLNTSTNISFNETKPKKRESKSKYTIPTSKPSTTDSGLKRQGSLRKGSNANLNTSVSQDKKTISNSKQNSRPNSRNNSNSRSKKIEELKEEIKPIPCFIDTKEQFILSNINAFVKKLDSLFTEKTKLVKKAEVFEKEMKEVSNTKESNNEIKNIQKQKLQDSKIVNLELKINNNNVALDKLENEIQQTEKNIKENLTKMQKRIATMKGFIKNTDDVDEKEEILQSHKKTVRRLDFEILDKYEIEENNDNKDTSRQRIFNLEGQLYDLEEKLVFIELENMCKEKRITELETLLKEKDDYYEEQLVIAKTTDEVIDSEDYKGSLLESVVEENNLLINQTKKKIGMEQYGTNFGGGVVEVDLDKENFEKKEKDNKPKPFIPKMKK